jgi:hypothetical protein
MTEMEREKLQIKKTRLSSFIVQDLEFGMFTCDQFHKTTKISTFLWIRRCEMGYICTEKKCIDKKKQTERYWRMKQTFKNLFLRPSSTTNDEKNLLVSQETVLCASIAMDVPTDILELLVYCLLRVELKKTNVTYGYDNVDDDM